VNDRSFCAQKHYFTRYVALRETTLRNVKSGFIEFSFNKAEIKEILFDNPKRIIDKY